ncbi:unnamed protein product [Malus baccata var. baccata]
MERENINISRDVDGGKKGGDGGLEGFAVVSSTRIDWKPRKRSLLSSASGRNIDKVTGDTANNSPDKQEVPITEEEMQDVTAAPELSERRKALFEPLEPITNINGKRPSAESLLPPPDFDAATYPKGWLIGKKRKLVNVDVVEKMRRIAVQEMNRKVSFPNRSHHLQPKELLCNILNRYYLLSFQDREIDGLNEQLEEDARCLEHLQLQLLQERSKRSDVERENAMLQDQVTMLMNMLQDDTVDDGGPDEP